MQSLCPLLRGAINMLERVKSFLSLIAGWLAAGAIFLYFLLSRRRPNARAPVRVEPEKVPDAWEEVEKAAKKEGILK